MIQWHHITSKQPEDGRAIIQIDAPWECDYNGDVKKHYCMVMRRYDNKMPWDDFCKRLGEEELPLPNFWWCYAADFPFPEPREGAND